MHFLGDGRGGGGGGVVNLITSDFLGIHARSGQHMSIISEQKILEINLVTLST